MTEKIDAPLNVLGKLAIGRDRLAKAQIKKSGKGQYIYLELADFLPTCHEIFLEVGLCATLEFTGEFATLRVTNVDNKDDFVLFTSPVVAAQLVRGEPIKVLGATQTYIRRYLWIQALEISVPDEVDAGSTSGPFSPQKPLSPTTTVSRETVAPQTFDSIENMVDDLPEATIEERIAQIVSTSTVDALNRLYKSFPKTVRDDKRIINACADRKISMTEPPVTLDVPAVSSKPTTDGKE